MPRAAKRPLLFLHVPKAGGTAVAGALGNRFMADECLEIYYADDPADDQLNAASYVTGHVSMSIVDRFERRPFTVTVLRDPIERALSIFSFFRELDAPSAPRMGLERNDAALRLAKEHPLEEFIEVAPDLTEHYLGNWQARMIGGCDLERADEQLEDAVAGLHSCDFVGLAERQNESVDHLTRRLGWAELTPLPRVNVTWRRLQREEVSPGGMEALEEITSMDRELYAEAVRVYESHANESGMEDGTGEIEDSPLVSDLRFDQPIRGAGWLGRERSGDQPYVCWIGSTASARVELADDRAARTVDVEIGHVADPTLLETLRITVNGRTAPHRLARLGTGMIASVPLKRRLGGRQRTVQVELAVDRAARPSAIDPSSRDHRELAISVRRIVLSRRSAA